MPLISGIYTATPAAKPKRGKRKAKKANAKRKATRQTMPYQDYLKTAYWQKVREAKFAQVGRKCQVCGATERLQVHHKHYRHRGKELHHLDCLMVVCRKCHELVHRVAA